MQSLFDMIGSLFELVIFLAIVAAVIAFWSYNKLRAPSENVKEALANVTIVARKKVAMVNQLVDVARAYQNNENLVFLKLSDDASAAAIAASAQQSGQVMAAISGMAQRFPELKSSQQYNVLMAGIMACEQDLENIRKNYNSTAKSYNVLRTSIPHVFIAGTLGFRVAPYMTLEAVEGPDQMIQKSIVSDDGERVKELLSGAGSKMLEASRAIAEKGKLLAEKGAERVQAGYNSAAASSSAEFHYLDAEKNPKGPISKTELDSLFQSGTITAQTDVLKAGSKSWTKYDQLQS